MRAHITKVKGICLYRCIDKDRPNAGYALGVSPAGAYWNWMSTYACTRRHLKAIQEMTKTTGA